MSLYKKIHSDWKKLDYQYFWGDPMDSRFFVLNKIPKNHHNKILDIGCSVGVVLRNTVGKNKIGIDIDFNSLKIGKQNFPEIEFISASANFLPFIENSFDFILSIYTLDEYEIDQNVAIGEIERTLSDKGEIFLTGNWYKLKHKRGTSTPEKIHGLWVTKLSKNFSFTIRGYTRPKMVGIKAKIEKLILMKSPNFIFNLLRPDLKLYNSYIENLEPVELEPYIISGNKINV